MRRIKATFEIKCLKELLGIYRNRIINLNAEIHQLTLENMELRKQLEESRAKEGKGYLERVMENLTKAFASLNFSKMLESNPELLEIEDEEDDNNAI